MPRPKKPKAPAPGEKGAPITPIPIVEEKREKYTIQAISDEEYRKFGNTERKSEVKQIAEEIIEKVLESSTPLLIRFNEVKVRQIIPVLSQLIRDRKIKVDFKASVKDNSIAIKKIQQ